MSQPIASRSLHFKHGDDTVVEIAVTLGLPIPDPRDPGRTWACPYEIKGFAEPVTRAIFGVNSMQALILGLHTLPSELRALAREEGGHFQDEEDLGLDFACKVNLGLHRE
jgi:hypothetical protein